MLRSYAGFQLKHSDLTIREKIMNMSFSFIFFITLLACIGFLMQYSAANGKFIGRPSNQMARYGLSLLIMVGVSLINIRTWLKYSYVLHAIAVILLIAVDVMGFVGMGAQRWINLGFIQLQPSELTKITLVMALARYFHSSSIQEIETIRGCITPILITIIPVGLVMKQPDLGTGLMLLMCSGVMFLLVGVQMWKFGIMAALGLSAIPIGWQFLHDYQRQRVLTFLDPERDPLGAGYHILQSQITLGSGGIFGKGFLKGTQSHLNFLPEKHTDFIFTMFAEEFGLIGSLFLICLCLIILAYGFSFAMKSQNYYGRILALGLTTNFFLYIFINIAMVMGLIPVVGVPLPLISYGGTVILTIMTGFGLIMSVYIHQDIQIGRRGASSDDL